MRVAEKAQAMVNGPDRTPQEVVDIEMLMRLYGAKSDWQRVEDFYDIGLRDEADRLKQRFGHA